MNILLFANIGTWSNKFYHVGDEAMFIATLKWYKKHHPTYKITCFTSSANHQNFKIKEINNPIQISNFSSKLLLKLILKTLILKWFEKNLFNKNESIIIETIKKQNIIHLTGGGHLNSIYSDWLYYSLSIIAISKIFHKKIYITSHSLGPFNFKDLIITSLVLNQTNKIILREPVNIFTKIRYFLFCVKIIGKIDSAYFLPKKTIKIKKKQRLRIGISLHQNQKNNQLINQLIESLKQISNNHQIEILPIPHIITTNKQEHDQYFMNNFLQKIPKIKKTKISTNKILNSNGEIAEKINYLSSTCDLLITTRYHGLIFSLSNSVPCLCLYSDKYYKQKFIGALKFIYPESEYKEFLIGGHDTKKLHFQLKNIIKKINQEKKFLRKINKKIKTNKKSLYN